MSTCKGAPAPHNNCPHGNLCDWDRPQIEHPTIHPANDPESPESRQAAKEAADREARFRDSIRHLPLRRQRKMLAKYGLEGPTGGEHRPQQPLSRRQRRAMARATQKDRKGLENAVYAAAHVDVSAHNAEMEDYPGKGQDSLEPALLHEFAEMGYSNMTLTQLRKIAQDKHLRVDGKRPSLCSKKELLEALEAP